MKRYAMLAALAIGCMPGKLPSSYSAPATYSAGDREENATVVLLSTDRDRHPDCSAVSVLNRLSDPVLATAAHCVSHRVDPGDLSPGATRTATSGDVIWYLAKGNWVSPRRAMISTYDPIRDVATLYPLEAFPAPVERHDLCDECLPDPFPVHAVSALYGWQRSSGRVTGETYAGGLNSHFWESDMTIVPGWSGSPVFDDSGSVTGIVIRCEGTELEAGDHLDKSCEPNFSIFTDLP